MNRSLDVMQSKPGIYTIMTPGGAGWVEVDHEGRCWQLKFTDFSRDGELIPGNWHPQNIIAIVGPLYRAAPSAPARSNAWWARATRWLLGVA